MNSDASLDSDQLTKVPEEPLVTSSRRKVKPEAPKPKVWKKGRLVDNPEYKAQEADAGMEKKKGNLAKGREVLREKREAKKRVREKIEAGIPITPQEASLSTWQAGGIPATDNRARSTWEKEQEILNKTANLIIKPANVHELRLKVEQAAARLGYDPLESLIRMVQEYDLKAEERISIHRTLLPYLVPTMPPIPKDAMEVDGKKVKVVVQQFHFAPEIKAGEDLFKERPKTVDVEVMAPDNPV